MLRVASTTTRVLTSVVVLLGVLLVTGALAGCGSDPEDTTEVEEGLPMKLGDLVYNVQISRPLNPSDPEDKAYLAGQPPPPNDKLYLGVFMQVENDGDTPQELPAKMTVVDTAGGRFDPLPSDSLFALDLGGTVPGDRQAPDLESTAANGPIQGAMVLFLIDEAAIEDLPLTLDIPSSAGSVGEVELDI